MSDPQSIFWQLELQIPATKLRPPDTQDTIKRERLSEELLHEVLTKRLTLISAPVGSGKTTLVADWVTSVEHINVYWLSLDDSDNDIQIFLLVMIMSIFPTIDNELLQMIHQGQVSAQQVANLLVNHLDTISAIPLVLILDDLHVLTDTDIFDFLDYFIDYMPSHVHIIATTRYDPPLALPKLRTHNELAEFRLDSLRFDYAEVDFMLNGLLNLEISNTLIKQMVDRTEGWIAGIRLLSLSLSKIDVSKRQKYIENLEEHDRYVFELLAEEVLFQQPNETRTFLLQTAILNELTSELCNAITGQSDSSLRLQELHRNNLFLVAIGKDIYVYHTLFRNFLLEQLRHYQAHHISDLHRLAAKAHSTPAQKIHHYLKAQEWTKAIKLIGTHGRRLMEHSNRDIVVRWLEALPDDYYSEDGWIIYLRGMVAYHRGDFPLTMQRMQEAEAWFQENENSEGMFESIIMQNATADDEHDFDYQMSFANRMEPHITTAGQRLVSKLHIAWVNLYFARRVEAAEHFYEILDLLEQTPEKIGFLGFQLGAPMVIVFDNLSYLRTRVQYIIDTFNLETHVFHAAAQALFANIAFWQGDIVQAKVELNTSIAIWSKLGGINKIHKQFLQHIQLAIAFAEGDNQNIEQLTLEYRNNPPGQSNFAVMRARWAWLQGDKAESRHILDHFAHFDKLGNSTVGKPYRMCIEALQALDEGRFEVIEHQLIEIGQHQWNNYSFYSTFVLDLRVTLAYCYLQIGLQQEALITVKQLLRDHATWNVPGRLAQEGGFIDPLLELAIKHNLYLDFIHQVQAIRHASQEILPIEIAETGETLTIREVEVLQMIIDGASNQQIADTCIISIPTVKTHVSHILQKLNVSSRTQAAAKANDLRLF